MDNPQLADDEMQNLTQYNKIFSSDQKTKLIGSLKNKDAQMIAGQNYDLHVARGRDFAQKKAGAQAVQNAADMLENQRQRYVLEGNKDGLEKTYAIAETKFHHSKDAIEIMRREDLAKMAKQEEANKKLASDAAYDTIQGNIQNYIKDNPKASKQEVRTLIEKQIDAYPLLDSDKRRQLQEHGGTYYNYWHEKTENDEKQTNYQKQVAGYDSIIKAFIDNKISPDIIENTDLTKDDKEEVNKSMFKSYQPAPTKSTIKGSQAMYQMVMDYSMTKQGNFEASQSTKLQAYKELLKMRYQDGIITDADFKWAVDKINNPYPKDIAADVQDVLNSAKPWGFWETPLKATRASLKGWKFGTLGMVYEAVKAIPEQSPEEADTSKTFFTTWLDTQIKAGKTPTKEEMFVRMKEFQAGNYNNLKEQEKDEYAKGQKVTINGKTYTYQGDGKWKY
jgi:hypothetical protein